MKAINIISIILFVGFIAVQQSCDIIEEPYLTPTDTIPINGGDTNQAQIRKILLEDYTGHLCPNCPEAAEEAHKLKLLYGDSIVVLAVHAGFFAEPMSQGLFTADYGTPEGTEFNNHYGIQEYPSGLVNRTDYNGSTKLNVTQWEGAVKTAVRQQQLAEISIMLDYNSGTRELGVSIESEFLESLSGTYSISVFISEDGIISPQVDNSAPGGYIENYEHNHMLRASLNGTWGDPVGLDGTAVAGETENNNYTTTLDNGWIDSNCRVVAFIYKDDTREIIQAEESHVEVK